MDGYTFVAIFVDNVQFFGLEKYILFYFILQILFVCTETGFPYLTFM